MKKKNLGGLMVAAIVAVATWNVNIKQNNDAEINLNLASIEAHAWDIGEWWDRPDWECITVACYIPFSEYNSTMAQFKGEGMGTEAHSWNCPGCNL